MALSTSLQIACYLTMLQIQLLLIHLISQKMELYFYVFDPSMSNFVCFVRSIVDLFLTNNLIFLSLFKFISCIRMLNLWSTDTSRIRRVVMSNMRRCPTILWHLYDLWSSLTIEPNMQPLSRNVLYLTR